MATQEQPAQSSELSPSQAMLQMTAGHWICQAIYVAAKLGIADLLRDGPRSSEELAQSTGTHPRALCRLLRALASVGMFRESEDGSFELTPRAACLLSDVPGSLRAVAAMSTKAPRRCRGGVRPSMQRTKRQRRRAAAPLRSGSRA